SESPVQESVRNRILRRADWRFLLPTHKPCRTVCYATGSLAQSAKTISESMVDPCGDTDGECDWAIAVDPTPTILRRAYAALRPGGSCYVESYAPIPGGIRRVCSLLKAAGFESITCYWAWPTPSWSPARFWVPLGASGSLDYFA